MKGDAVIETREWPALTMLATKSARIRVTRFRHSCRARGHQVHRHQADEHCDQNAQDEEGAHLPGQRHPGGAQGRSARSRCQAVERVERRDEERLANDGDEGRQRQSGWR